MLFQLPQFWNHWFEDKTSLSSEEDVWIQAALRAGLSARAPRGSYSLTSAGVKWYVFISCLWLLLLQTSQSHTAFKGEKN